MHNVLSPDEGEWLSDEENTGDQGFILMTRGCKRKITGFRIMSAMGVRTMTAMGIRFNDNLNFPPKFSFSTRYAYETHI